MEESDHAAAARRYADEVRSGSGDPAVLAVLAQTEALSAVATAIDRLTAVLTGPNAPTPSPAEGQAYRVEQVRRQHPNAYLPWTAEADAALLAAHQAGHDVAALADTFGRQPSAIRSRLNRLGANAPAAQQGDPSLHTGSGTPRVGEVQATGKRRQGAAVAGQGGAVASTS